MKQVKTKDSDTCFKLPGGTAENDLWVEAKEVDGRSVLGSVWEPTPEERARIMDGANIELMVWGTGTPPVKVGITMSEAVKSGPKRE